MFQQNPSQPYQLQAMGTQGFAGYGEEHGGPYDGGEGMYADDANDSYQKYTEGGAGGGRQQIDSNVGIAPRGLTDCVVIWVFLAYVLGMVVIVMYTNTLWIGSHRYGDIERLSHAMNHEAQLCGVDPLKEQKFLYYCRSGPPVEKTLPLELNTEHPTCVDKCPDSFETEIPCLYAKQAEVVTVEGGQFGNVKTFHLTAEQNTILTASYPTIAFGGRYCVPKDSDLKAQILGFKGPMNPLWRLRNATASFEHPWLVLFLCSILAVVLGFFYLYMLKVAGACMMGTFLVISFAVTFFGGLFFLVGIVGVVEKVAGITNLGGFETYRELNPFYGRFTTIGASIISVIIAITLIMISFVMLFVFAHQVAHDEPKMNKKVKLKAAFEAVFAMRSLAITPLVLGAVKFLACMILAQNFMVLASVGYFNDRRIEVNGDRYMGADKTFRFDWGILPWMLYYLFGWVWIMEVMNAIGHFLISFSVISWYFMAKENGVKSSTPNAPIWTGFQTMLVYHMGSVLLGAAMVPVFRLVRLFNWPTIAEDDENKNESAQYRDNCVYSTLRCVRRWGPYINGCKKCCLFSCGGLCSPCIGLVGFLGFAADSPDGMPWPFIGLVAFLGFAIFRVFAPALVAPGVATSGALLIFMVFLVVLKFMPAFLAPKAASRFTKDAYSDVIIRSNHYWESSSKVLETLGKKLSCRVNVIEGKGLQVVTIAGATTIGVICSGLCYVLLMTMPGFQDPLSSNYINDPLAVCFLCFLLCGPCIGYGFTMLVDHSFDTLLYCYAWNKKFCKNSGGAPVDDYIPDSLKDIVNIDNDDDLPPYGNARPHMYLDTWIPTGWFPSKKDSARGQAAGSTYTASMGGASGSRAATTGFAR